ncbi:MAG: helix-hairpin-helix domain-containing protein [Cyanobacteria bacterium J06614_10]
MIQTTLFPDTFRQIFSLSNDDIARSFEQVADLLEAKGDDYYRIRAYRKGAQSVRNHSMPVVDLYEAEGTAGLEKLPYIGKGLASAIQELATTGQFTLLEQLHIDVSPEDLFTTVPGIGQVLARRIYRGLGIDTLAGLEQAAHDGILTQMPGFGPGRMAIVRTALATMLNRPARSSSNQSSKQNRQLQQVPIPYPQPEAQPVAIPAATSSNAPSVDLLLAVDTQYRYLASAGQLRMVKPKRFNPEGKRWLPIMQLSKGGWAFNALYSNTARAHALGKTDDWVVVYYERDGQRGQCTVVTESQGVNKGKRVVRGQSALEVAAS